MDLHGKIHFFLIFIGANLTFFPMHFLGFLGMPRRIPDFPIRFYIFNFISSLGAWINFFSLIIFLIFQNHLIVDDAIEDWLDDYYNFDRMLLNIEAGKYGKIDVSEII